MGSALAIRTSVEKNMSRKEPFLSLVLAMTLLVTSYVRIWGDTGSALFSSGILQTVSDAPLWSTTLGKQIFFFGIAQLTLHLCFGLVCLGFAYISAAAWPKWRLSVRTWLLLWFFLFTCWLLVTNLVLFPWSSISATYTLLWDDFLRNISLLRIATAVLVTCISLTILKVVFLILRSHQPKRHRWALTLGIGSAAIGFFTFTAMSTAKGPVPNGDRPNIIFIGLDSLRTDRGQSDGATNYTPAIDLFLTDSALFTNTATPLARTFPAWVSILSGQHPHTTGAFENLLPRAQIHAHDTLPEMLRAVGYNTIYATDESRFSNLDETYGFNKIVAPPMGAADFILSFFSDTPLSNLLSNTRIGEWLFPWTYANRAAVVTYDPDSFVEKLGRKLPSDAPVFLAIHLTLAHQPYTWATAPESPSYMSSARAPILYNDSLKRIDKQFNDVVRLLERRGLLHNAIVVVLSDHGESLDETTNGLFPVTSIPGIHFDRSTSFGHGTNVLSDHQYKVVLGIRTFGETPFKIQPGSHFNEAVSLEDLAPTIADAFSLPHPGAFDGISLLPLIKNDSDENAGFSGRIRFRESGFNPPDATLEELVAFGSTLKRTASYYRVDPGTGRVNLKPEYVGEILADRQYAAFRNDRLLASIPSSKGAEQILIATDGSGKASLWLPPADPATDPDSVALWQALQGRYAAVRDRPVAGVTAGFN